jgi:hypothetical protein
MIEVRGSEELPGKGKLKKHWKVISKRGNFCCGMDLIKLCLDLAKTIPQ